MDTLLNESERLISLAQCILNECETQRKKERTIEGGGFNVFESTGIIQKENRMSNFLVALMTDRTNPQYWRKFAGIFLKEVICDPVILSAFESSQFAARREDSNENGRCDIRLEVGNYLVPIEVKINASLRRSQLSDYFASYKDRLTERQAIYYLTKHGESPNSEGMGGLAPNNVISLSWDHQVKRWVDLCIEGVDKKKGNEKLLYSLYMFRDAITIFCGEKDMAKQFSDEEIGAVSKIIMADGVVSDAAYAIFLAVRNRLLETDNVFSRIKRKVEDDPEIQLTYWDQMQNKPGGNRGFNQKTYVDFYLGNSPSNGWVGLPFFFGRHDNIDLFIFAFVPTGSFHKLTPNALHVSLVTGYQGCPEPPLDNAGLLDFGFERGECDYSGYKNFTSVPISTQEFGTYSEAKEYPPEALDSYAQKAYELIKALFTFCVKNTN